MNPVYSNDPKSIGIYHSNSNLLLHRNNIYNNINVFSNNKPVEAKFEKPLNEDIMTLKPRNSVPEQFQSVGTLISKSCNLPGVSIDRFELADKAIQDPMNIILNEPFRGGAPSRIVAKDEYVKSMKKP